MTGEPQIQIAYQTANEKELLVDHITKDRVIYSVYDVFLSRWLEREY